MSEKISDFIRIHLSGKGLNRSEIETIANVAKYREYLPGEIAMRGGDESPAISLVISGLFTMSVSEDPATAFGCVRPNHQFGTMPIVENRESPSYIIAVEPSVVIQIENEDAKRLLDECKLFARNLLGMASAHMTQLAIDGGNNNRPQRVAFLHLRSETQPVSKLIQQRLCEIGESVGRIINEKNIPSDDFLGRCETLNLGHSETRDHDRVVREQLAEWPSLDRVVFDFDFQNDDLTVESLRELLRFPERVFILVTPDSARDAIGPLRDVLKEHAGWTKKLNLIWVLDDEHDVAPLMPELTSLFDRDFKIKISTGSNVFFQRTSQPGIERVVHDLRGVKVGVALGGGAARGMCHLGVLKAMDESGIVIDAIAGTSVGAMMGVSYCVGYSPDNGVQRFTQALTPDGVFRLLGDKMYLLYKYRSKSWEGMLRRDFFNWHLEQMLVPLTTIAADLISAEEYVRRSGDGVLGILESINLGGIATPICRDGMALVDGGYLNNVPADTLVRDGANFVMSVDVTKSISKRLGSNFPDTPTEKMKVPRIHQVLSRINEVTQKTLSLIGSAQADFTIAPDVSHVSFADFKSTPQTAEIGYQAGLKAMPKLKARLHRLDPELFPLDEATREQLTKTNAFQASDLRRAG